MAQQQQQQVLFTRSNGSQQIGWLLSVVPGGYEVAWEENGRLAMKFVTGLIWLDSVPLEA